MTTQLDFHSIKWSLHSCLDNLCKQCYENDCQRFLFEKMLYYRFAWGNFGSKKKTFNSFWNVFDPLGRPTFTVFTHVVRQNRAKQNNFKVRIGIAIGGIVGLAEGIIDDPCLV